ncbi:hypothetical protein [Clostridium uliginosum]|uniref:Uncharacterized protein n=1 Tax=Clostridium uliginosum TaxID=119641 RepID=A0A1I1HK22_9CLOT|nr:hypothetical protein [Clostridium uliginosum]SFC21440.1 hypothetical protein SAMN05421842_101254 [Clostridium uliginosum]
MQKSKVLDLTNIYSKHEKIAKEVANNEYKIYTPYMVKKYKSTFKVLNKLTNNRDHTLYIMYGKVKKWYGSEKKLNVSMEKIHVKTKLGSYLSGGCGIGASLLTNLTASGMFAYSTQYIKNFGPLSLICYVFVITCFGITVLCREDDQVEMYNMFLEVLNELDGKRQE